MGIAWEFDRKIIKIGNKKVVRLFLTTKMGLFI